MTLHSLINELFQIFLTARMPKKDANAFLNIDLIPDEPLIATPLNRHQQPSTLQSSVEVPSCLERQKEEEKHELFSNR